MRKLMFSIFMILFSFAIFNGVLAADVECSTVYASTYCYPVCDECAAACDQQYPGYESARCGHYPLIDIYDCAGEITTSCDGNTGKVRYDTGVTCDKYAEGLFGPWLYATGKCYCFDTDVCSMAGCIDGLCVDVPSTSACLNNCKYGSLFESGICGPKNSIFNFGDDDIFYADSYCIDDTIGMCYSCVTVDGDTFSCGKKTASGQIKMIEGKRTNPNSHAFYRGLDCSLDPLSSTKEYCMGLIEVPRYYKETDDNYFPLDVFYDDKKAYFCANNMDCGSIIVDYWDTYGDVAFYVSHSGWMVDNIDETGGVWSSTPFKIGYDAHGTITAYDDNHPAPEASIFLEDGIRGFEFQQRPLGMDWDEAVSVFPVWAELSVIGNGAGYALEYDCGSGHSLFVPIPMVQTSCVHRDCGAVCEKDYFISGTYCACPECDSSCTGYELIEEETNGQGFAMYLYNPQLGRYDSFKQGTCPQPSDNYHTGYVPPYDCRLDLKEDLKSVCIYGEQCGDIYNLPYLTDKIYDGTDILCTCDATYATNDNVKDCGLNSVCANINRGVRVNDVACDETGWGYGDYIEAEIKEVAVYNTYGDFYKYTGDKPTDDRETDLTAYSGNPDNLVEFDDQDYISLQITVENIGTATMSKPFLLVTTEDFHPDYHSSDSPERYLTAYKNLLALSDSTFDVRRQWDPYPSESDFKYLLTTVWGHHITVNEDGSSNIGKTSDLIDGAGEAGDYSILLEHEAIAFWFSSEFGEHSRTSNIELVQETGTAWNGVIEEGDEMTFVLYVKASEWDPNMHIYFWDLDTSLHNVDTLPAVPRDYLTHIDLSPHFNAIQVNDYDFDDVHVYQVIDENTDPDYNPCSATSTCDSDLGQCIFPIELPECRELFCTFGPGGCVNIFTGMGCVQDPVCPKGYRFNPDGFCEKSPTPISCREGYVFDSGTCRCEREFQYIIDENKLQITGDVISASGLAPLDCTDCLHCFASRLDSDSFGIFWLEQENPIVLDESPSFYSDLYQLNRWAGMYFMPRAHSIILDAQIGTIQGESEVSFETDQDFSWATAAYSSSSQRDDFMLAYTTDAGLDCELPEDISSEYYSLSLMQNEPMMTLRAQEADNTPFEHDITLTGMKITYSGNEYVLDERGTVHIDQAPDTVGPGSSTLGLVLTDSAGNPLENFLISLVNGDDAYPEMVQTCDDCVSEGNCDCGDSEDNDGDDLIDETKTEFLNWEFIGMTTALTDEGGAATIELEDLAEQYDKLWFVVNYISQFTPLVGTRIDLIIPGYPVRTDWTGADGEVIFDLCDESNCEDGIDNDLDLETDEYVDSLDGTKAVMFGTDGSFLSALDIYDVSRIECTAGCGCSLECGNGIDDDSDGATDEKIDGNCDDWNCPAPPSSTSFDITVLGEEFTDPDASVILYEYEIVCLDENCEDDTDNDGDGRIDEEGIQKTGNSWSGTHSSGGRYDFNWGSTNPMDYTDNDFWDVKNYVMEIGTDDGEEYQSISDVTITIDNGNGATGAQVVGITNRKEWGIATEEVTGFVRKLTCENNLGVKYPFEHEISLVSGDCDNMRIYDGSWDEIPYQVVESDFDSCTVALVVDQNDEVNFYYGSVLASEPVFDSTWLDISGVESEDLQFEWDVMDFEYSMDCLAGTGPCLRFLEDKTDSDEWSSHGLMRDMMVAENVEVEIYVDGPVKKCFDFLYEVNMPAEVIVIEDLEGLENNTVEYTASEKNHDVNRKVCVYDGVPAIFETIEFIGDDITHRFSQSIKPRPVRILNSGLLTQVGFSDPLPAVTGSTTGANAIWDGELVLVTNLEDPDIRYHINPEEVLVQDPYISDLYNQYKDITMTMPDSVLFRNSTYNVMNLDYETLEIMSMMGYQYNNGSMNYYSSRWTTSGTTENCDPEDTNQDNVYGTTCDAGTSGGVAISLGIQRTGAHMIKFVTPEEDGQDSGVIPDISLFNSMGEVPRTISFENCSVIDGSFTCVVEEDDKGYAIDTSRMGYVMNCMLYDPDYQDITTRYFNPYIFPMKWEVDYNLVVNPYIPTPVPVLIEEKDDQLMATTCGDWICQKDVEYCYNCPSDCSDLVNSFEPTIG